MLKKLKRFRQIIIRLGIVYVGLLYGQISWASLPPAPKNTNFTNGDVIAGIWDFIAEGIKYLALGLAAAAIIGYGFALVGTFLEAKKHKTWGDFGIVAIIGAAVVIIAIILATEANTYFATTS